MLELNEVINKLLPGFDTLDEQWQSDFLKTEAGIRIQEYYNQSIRGNVFYRTIAYVLWSDSDQYDRACDKLEEDSDDLLSELKEMNGFLSTRMQIICVRGLQSYPYLRSFFEDHDEMASQFGDHIDLWSDVAVDAQIKEWHQRLCPDDQEVSQHISSYLVGRKKLFSSFLPGLLGVDIPSFEIACRSRMKLVEHVDAVEMNKIEWQALAEVILAVMNEKTQGYQPYHVSTYNKERAELFARTILDAIKKSASTLPLSALFEQYKTGLIRKISDSKLFKINGEDWIEMPIPPPSISGSLSSMLQSLGDAMNLNLLADGRAIMQATGFATQNESTPLAFLDYINYLRYSKTLSETKSIFAGLLRPMLPLYCEYRAIGLNEKSLLWHQIRALIPSLIIAGFVVLTFGILSSFALPEIAALVVMIPTIYVAALVAAKYIELRDYLFKLTEEWVYGGPYQVPLYQANDRMLHAFGSQELADEICRYFTEELLLCDTTESYFATIDARASLSEDDISQRKQNIVRRNELSMAWVDIHNNHNVGTDTLPQMVMARLHKDGDQIYRDFKKEVADDLSGVCDDIQIALTSVSADNTHRFFNSRNLCNKPYEPYKNKLGRIIELEQHIKGRHEVIPTSMRSLRVDSYDTYEDCRDGSGSSPQLLASVVDDESVHCKMVW